MAMLSNFGMIYLGFEISLCAHRESSSDVSRWWSSKEWHIIQLSGHGGEGSPWATPFGGMLNFSDCLSVQKTVFWVLP